MMSNPLQGSAERPVNLDSIRTMAWDNWKYHPDWLTERQHQEKKLIPGGEPVAKVWYVTKQLIRSGQGGHWILLFDVTKATPRSLDPSKQAAVERAKLTAEQNKTCDICGRVSEHKIKHKLEDGRKMCGICRWQQTEIEEAREWLANENAVILDTETKTLHGEVVSVSVIDIHGNILLDTLVKPTTAIDERLYTIEEGYYGEREKPTAFAINGISNEMVKNAPTFAELWPRLFAILNGKLMLCYNADYDYGCLWTSLQAHHLNPDWTQDQDCVMRWYAQNHSEWVHKWRDYRNVSLSDACREQGAVVGEKAAHTAGGDCQRTLALIQAIAAKKAPLDADTSSGSTSYREK